MTFTQPDENTLGVVIGNVGRAVSGTAKRLGRTNATHRSTLGTSFLGLGAAILVGLRAVYGFSWFVALWSEGAYPQPLAAFAAWVVLAAVIIGAIVSSRINGDRMPDWIFTLILAGIALAVALDLIAVWELHDIGRYATAALAAGMTLLVVVTLRGPIEIIAAAISLAVVLALMIFLNTPPGTELDADWIAPQLSAVAFAVLPAIIGVAVVEGYRRMVQVELDRVLVQSTVSAPRFAVGMLASEELARLDLAAEQLLDAIATKKTALPLDAEDGIRRGVAGDRAAPAPHRGSPRDLAVPRDQRVRDARQVGDARRQVESRGSARSRPARRIARDRLAARERGQEADVEPDRHSAVRPRRSSADHPVPEHKIAIPITITTTGVARNRVDPSIWDALGRVGRYSDSTQDQSLRVDIECIVDNPAEL